MINAWYAVGLGALPDSNVKAMFGASKNTSCSIPLTVQFYNNSINGISYVWDFGDGQSSAITNPVHTYSAWGNYTVKLLVNGCNGFTQDSTIAFQYIKIDSNLAECKQTIMPKSGLGSPITSCSGTLRDDGDTAKYGSLVYSIRSIIPVNSSILKLHFKQFDFENNFDFLYIYDGPDTLGNLIGKYTGNTLPEGGILLCKSGAATIRQTSDYLVTDSGFELDWQCIPKSLTDFKLEAISQKIIGRKYTSSELKSNHLIPVKIKSNGTDIGNTTQVKFQLNNGSIISKSITLNAGISNTELGPFDFSAVGINTIVAWIDDPADGVKENDSLKLQIQQLDNAPINLPFIENFDLMDDVWLYKNSQIVGGNPRLDYENSSTQCRLRTYAGADFITGIRSVTLDKSDRNWLFDTVPQSNFLILTYNMSEAAKLKSPILFRVNYMQHGDRKYPNDAVWLRGCDTCAWIKFFDLFASKAAAGIVKIIPLHNLNYFLDSARQTAGSSFQIRIGQQDQNSAINTQQYAGYTFDNLRFSTWNNGIDEMTGKELINVYPNPSNGVFIINTTEKFKRLELTDLKGILIGSYLLPESYYFELDLTNLAKSVYLANFIDENNLSHVRRLIIK